MLATKHSISGLCSQVTYMNLLKNLISRNLCKRLLLNVHREKKTPKNLYFTDNQRMNIASIVDSVFANLPTH